MMPGMGALPDIFRFLKIHPDFQVKYLHWISPQKNEEFPHYVSRLIENQINPDDKNPVLLGMSFGGMVANEIARQMPVSGLVFLSTVKTHREFPPWFALGRITRYHAWAPFGLLLHPARLKPYVPFKFLKRRLDLYDRYLGIREVPYFRWAVKTILNWKGEIPSVPYIHIHGNRDRIFPPAYLKPPVDFIPGATHMAVLTHPRQVSKKINGFLTGLTAK